MLTIDALEYAINNTKPRHDAPQELIPALIHALENPALRAEILYRYRKHREGVSSKKQKIGNGELVVI